MWLSFTQSSIFSPQIRLCGTTLLKSPVKSSWNDSTKSYIGLFTCTSTPALHLELTHVQDFLLAFGRRGLPASIQFKDVPFTYRTNTKDHANFGSLEVPDKQSNKLEIHCGKGPMVGKLLAKTTRNWDLCQLKWKESSTPNSLHTFMTTKCPFLTPKHCHIWLVHV